MHSSAVELETKIPTSNDRNFCYEENMRLGTLTEKKYLKILKTIRTIHQS